MKEALSLDRGGRQQQEYTPPTYKSTPNSRLITDNIIQSWRKESTSHTPPPTNSCGWWFQNHGYGYDNSQDNSAACNNYGILNLPPVTPFTSFPYPYCKQCLHTVAACHKTKMDERETRNLQNSTI